jgi:hypothetical protein
VLFRSAVVAMASTAPAARRTRALLERPRGAERFVVVANRVAAGGDATRRELEALVTERIAVELPPCAALRAAEDVGVLLPEGRRWARRLDVCTRGVCTAARFPAARA